MTQLRINGVAHSVDTDPQMPLLWAIRDVVGLTGTKFGCGIGACGALENDEQLTLHQLGSHVLGLTFISCEKAGTRASPEFGHF